MSELYSSLIRYSCLFTMHLWKMLDFRTVLSKLLYTFYSSENGLNHDLHVVFYVGFRNFRKKLTLKINLLKIKNPILYGRLSLFMRAYSQQPSPGWCSNTV